MSKSLIDVLLGKGEEAFAKLSSELMQSPHFMKAMQAAWQGKEKLDQAVARALKQMNIPTRSEFKKAVARIDSLEQQLEELKAAAGAAGAAPAAPPKPARPAPKRAPAARRKPAAPAGTPPTSVE